MSENEIKSSLIRKFDELFQNHDGAKFFFAPGRVNLIGEHTDYNGGHVFPCALTIGTYAMVRERTDTKMRYYSLNIQDDGLIETDIRQMKTYVRSQGWTNYPSSVIWTFQEKGFPMTHGFDMVVYGDLPVSAGLSSSASVLVLMGFILRRYYHLDQVTNINLAEYGLYAEQKYIGLDDGIMDQFIIAMGRRDQAIFLDTGTMDYEYVPIHMNGYTLMIVNTNCPRNLHDSKYNERVAECSSALKDLQTVLPVKTLGDLTDEQFDQYAHVIQDPVCRRRAKHAVYENQRTVEAVKALKANDLLTFGRLMNESDISLRDDYEVTGTELDTLVDAAWSVPGVIGARMTGAGFGGCTVNLVRSASAEQFAKTVHDVYLAKIGYAPSFYPVRIGDGPAEL